MPGGGAGGVASDLVAPDLVAPDLGLLIFVEKGPPIAALLPRLVETYAKRRSASPEYVSRLPEARPADAPREARGPPTP